MNKMSMSSTDPGSRSAAEIEVEVDQERARVSDTIDALQSKLSVRHVVDEVSQALGEHGGEISRNLGRQIRDNPLPAILTGVGLAWLMIGAGPRANGGEDRRDLYRRGLPPELEPPRAGDNGGRTGFRERAADWGGSASDAASGAMQSAKHALGGARDTVADGGRSVRDAGVQARDWAGRQAHGVQDRLTAGIEDYPLVLGGIAFAVGAALGAVLPRTRAEDELVGAQADRLKQQAGDIASEQADKAMAVASAVADEGKRMVGEAADKIARELPDSDTMIERTREAARDAADRLRTAGEDEAGRDAADPTRTTGQVKGDGSDWMRTGKTEAERTKTDPGAI